MKTNTNGYDICIKLFNKEYVNRFLFMKNRCLYLYDENCSYLKNFNSWLDIIMLFNFEYLSIKEKEDTFEMTINFGPKSSNIILEVPLIYKQEFLMIFLHNALH